MLNWWRERQTRKRRRLVEQASVDGETEQERREEEIRDLQEQQRLRQQPPWGGHR